MTNAAAQNTTLAGTSGEFQTRVSVKMGFVENDKHYGAMVALMHDLLGEIGDHEVHPRTGLFDVVAFFVREYEERTRQTPNEGQASADQTCCESTAGGTLRIASEGTAAGSAVCTTDGDCWPQRRLALPRPGSYADVMRRVEIDLPDETFAALDRESDELAAEIRAAAAAKLYELGRVSQEIAAQIAGVSRSEFLTVLSKLKVSPMQESAEEAFAGADVLLQP